MSGYKEINLRALKLLKPGGFLVTCSCSYNVSEAMFADVLAAAAVDAHADVAVVEKRMQGRDHPVLMTVPETYYLKCFVLGRNLRIRECPPSLLLLPQHDVRIEAQRPAGRRQRGQQRDGDEEPGR